MTELKLGKLYRGFVLTDFNGNEIGIKDYEQAMEEIKKLIKPGELDEGYGQPVVEKSISGKSIMDVSAQKESPKKERRPTVEIHREIFEKAKEHINLTGKVSGAKISRELNINTSTVHSHLRKMNIELEALIKKWQDEHDKLLSTTETRTDQDGNKVE